MNEKVIGWLLEDENPAVKYRTQTELLGCEGDRAAVKSWLFDFLPKKWGEADGLWYRYYITAFAECGLTYADLPPEQLEKALDALKTGFDGCGAREYLLLGSLVKLGLAEHETVRGSLSGMRAMQTHDGGFVCRAKLAQPDKVPDGCYKACLQALRLCAECRKKGIEFENAGRLLDYFFERRLFYKSADSKALATTCREGKRIIDAFHPLEGMRLPIQHVVEAFSALGYGNDARLQEAWDILNSHKAPDGRFILKATLSKTYLPKEQVGAPSKWVTFYALLAEKHRGAKF